MNVDSSATPLPEAADAETAAFVERMLATPPYDDAAAPALPPVIPGLAGFVEVDRGGTGTIWRATRVADGRTVAVKILHAAGAVGQSACARARREAALLAELDHPNIVRVESSGEMHGAPGWPDGLPWLVMEWVAGDTLQRYVAQRSPGTREAVRIVRDLARAVEAVHARGIVHRDVKPANVILADGPVGQVPKLVDFGLARPGEGGESLTRTGAVLGTPGYMAAEQTGRDEGLGAVGPATDIHGLGGTLFFMLHRRPPHEGRTVAESFARAVTGAVDWRPPHGGPIPDALRAILETCLERQPSRRYPSAAALAADLDRFLDGRPVEARRRPWLSRLLAAAARRPALSTAAVLSALLVVTLAGGAWWHLRSVGIARTAVESALDLSRASLASLTDESVERMVARGPILDEADLAHLRRVRTLVRDLPLRPDRRAARSERIAALRRLATIFGKILRVDEAMECLDAAFEDACLLERDGGVAEAEGLRLNLLAEKGALLVNAGRPAEAEEPFRRALEIAETARGDDRDEHDLRQADARFNLGIALDRLGRSTEARTLIGGALADLARLRAASPDDFRVVSLELQSLFASAAAISLEGETAEVRRARLDVLIRLAEEAKPRFPSEHAGISKVEILGLAALTDLESEVGDQAKSLSTARCLRALVRADLAARPDDAFLRGEAIEAAIRESLASTRLGRPEESAALLEEALEMARRERAAEPAVIRHAIRTAKVLKTRAHLQRGAGRTDETIASMRELIDVLAPWAESTDGATAVAPLIAGARVACAQLLLMDKGDAAGAVDELHKAIALVPGQPEWSLLLAEAALASGDLAGAREAAEAAAVHPPLAARATALLQRISD